MEKNNKKPEISIVGAGPGDPELLTLKAARKLASADVVLYDALANHEILSMTKPSCIQVYVGKRASNHKYPQEEINKMMVDYARKFGHVVRLKGGDPFVFGRGHEEWEYCKSCGIHAEVIPGISSCLALPELQYVPVTKRNISQSFWVMTATDKDNKFNPDIFLSAQSSATVVILMGLGKLSLIVATYKSMGLKDRPVMIIQNGSLPTEKVVVSTISEIEKDVNEAGLSTPAIIVIGDVVRLHMASVKNEVIDRIAS